MMLSEFFLSPVSGAICELIQFSQFRKAAEDAKAAAEAQ